MSDPCRCECGYTCSTPQKMRGCDLELMECIDQHYRRDCDHVFTAEHGVEGETAGGGWFSSTACKCGLTSMAHDARAGP